MCPYPKFRTGPPWEPVVALCSTSLSGVAASTREGPKSVPWCHAAQGVTDADHSDKPWGISWGNPRTHSAGQGGAHWGHTPMLPHIPPESPITGRAANTFTTSSGRQRPRTPSSPLCSTFVSECPNRPLRLSSRGAPPWPTLELDAHPWRRRRVSRAAARN